MLSFFMLGLSLMLMFAAFIAGGIRIMARHLRSGDKMMTQVTFLVCLALALACAAAAQVTDGPAADGSIAMATAQLVILMAPVCVLGAAATFVFFKFRLKVRTARKWSEMTMALAERKFDQGCVSVRNRTVDVTHATLAFVQRRSV